VKYIVLKMANVYACVRCRLTTAPYCVVEIDHRGMPESEEHSCAACLSEAEATLLLDPEAAISEARFSEICDTKHDAFLRSLPVPASAAVHAQYAE
jgi:hypothetical protein